MVVQKDGKVVIGGEFSSVGGVNRNGIARLNEDGSLDSSFNPGRGVDGLFPGVYAVAMSADGKILAGGRFSVFNGMNQGGVVRLNGDGSLDKTFGSISIQAPPGSGEIHAVALQSDDKILIGGDFTNVGGTKSSYFDSAGFPQVRILGGTTRTG